MSLLAREIRILRKTTDDLERRLKSSHIQGVVESIEGDRVRIRIADEGAAGGPVLSPKVRWQEQAGGGGGITTWSPPKVGEPMVLISPGGEIGEQSYAVRGVYSQPNPAPDDRPGVHVIQAGSDRIELGGGVLKIVAGGTTHTFSADGASFEGDDVKHNDVSIGFQHVHTEVERGGDLSGPPLAE